MFGRKITLIRLLGLPISIDPSWFVIVALLTWSLATAYFPIRSAGFSADVYWTMGLIGALGLFASILLHELAHAAVARHYEIPMEGITLFLFGGVAEMKEEPPNAKVELLVAVAGPIASIFVATACTTIAHLGGSAGWPVPITGVFSYLGFINTVLVVFNAVPAFPLDGGRVLRAILWHIRGNLKWATKITSGIGSYFGTVLIILGVVTIIGGNFVGGMWQFLIGMFLRSAAQMSYQQVLIKRALEGEPVGRFMCPDPITVSPAITIEDLVEQFVYEFHHKTYPVVEGRRLLGCITTKDIRTVPREEWSLRTVGEIAKPCNATNSIEANVDAVKALGIMSRNEASRLLVIDNEQLCGVVTLKDLLRFIELKVDLEEDSDFRDSPRRPRP